MSETYAKLFRVLLTQWVVRMNMPGTTEEGVENAILLLHKGRMRYRLSIDEIGNPSLALDLRCGSEFRCAGRVP